MKITNYKVFYSLRILKSIITSFVEVFLVLYFLNVSNSNILPLGIYKLVSVVTIYLVIFLCKNFARSKHRANLLRIGIVFDLIYFGSIIFLRERVVDYIYLIGLLYGLEEGFYYSVYNMLESDGIKNSERAKFAGSYTATKSVLSIIFPILFGGLIHTTGFIKALIIVSIIIVIRMILSFLFKDTNLPDIKKTNIKKFLNITKDSKEIKQMRVVTFFSGLTYSEGAFALIVTIYIIKAFSDSFSLGVFTSIFSVMVCIIAILFAKFMKQKYYAPAILISAILTILSLITLIIFCNVYTIVIFNFCQTLLKSFMGLINDNSKANLCNDERIRKDYKVEYWVVDETMLVLSRILSNSIFILMAFFDTTIFIIIFGVFLAVLAYNSIKLQWLIKKKHETEQMLAKLPTQLDNNDTQAKDNNDTQTKTNIDN